MASDRATFMKRPAEDLGALSALLQDVRTENVRGARSKWGDCELVSDEFLSEARRRRLASPRDSFIVLGYRAYDPEFAQRRRIENNQGEHQWAVIGGTIYDGTSDQFSDSAITITPVGDPRYREKLRQSHATEPHVPKSFSTR